MRAEQIEEEGVVFVAEPEVAGEALHLPWTY